ncbi:hypothetical protein [Clostridium cylindrosporum]|uniref:Phage scaffold protein n=1 Tax=Clostridium cylindrosporum DSM 605 TaxID=1121307 RepID=A0A0J8G185_CLOCY|nr:hypothetical protein [Clostridium cylindrosporum]KMT21501.1 hypothetical protein CLCY_2c02620 [Clostridium cylindrosporum DSM 605]
MENNQVQETQTTVDTGVDTTTDTITTFTKEEVDKMLQSEGDKIRTKYNKDVLKLKEEIKLKEQYIESLKPVEEPVVEKSEAEIKAEQKLAELEAKELEIQAKEQHLNLVNLLNSKGLPSQLADIIKVGDNVETSINTLAELLNANKLNDSFKPDGRTSSVDVLTKEQFSKMSPIDRMNLFKDNEELYKKLSQR